jgi:hypothetical protein
MDYVRDEIIGCFVDLEALLEQVLLLRLALNDILRNGNANSHARRNERSKALEICKKIPLWRRWRCLALLLRWLGPTSQAHEHEYEQGRSHRSSSLAEGA